MPYRSLIPIAEARPALSAAAEALAYARGRRDAHRRRRRPDRQDELEAALEMLRGASEKVKPFVFAAAWRPIPFESELRIASESLQRERRKVRKMLRRST